MDLKGQKNFGARVGRTAARRHAECAPWTALLPDAADGLLTDVEQRALDQHLAGCVECTEELAEAQRGLAWLTVLKDQSPEPPLDLLSNILAQTTGVPEAGVSLPPLLHLPEPALGHGHSLGHEWEISGWRSWLGMGEGLAQPRLAMTGAMAFFSICLTLNLLGISVGQLNAQTLRSGGLHRTVSDTGASLVRSIQGLRVVYRVESRVSEMRTEMDSPSQANH